MEGFWPIFFLMVILKIPVVALLYLVWWAFRAATEPEPSPGADDGGFRRFRHQPKRPRGPRRGDHGPGTVALPECPPGGRTRILTPPAPVRAASARGTGRGTAEPERA